MATTTVDTSAARAETGSVAAAEEGGVCPVRLWAVSDIHTDLLENRAWVECLSDTAYRRDALIVAGDVSDDLKTLEATLRTLAAKFKTVFFTPGNHDLWMTDGDDASDSLAKLSSVLALCDELGVATRPRRVCVSAAEDAGGAASGDAAGSGPSAGVWVCPLLSWHHQSFDTEPDLEGWRIVDVSRVMTDYSACRFPPPLSMFDESVAEVVDKMNEGVDGSSFPELAQRLPEEPLVTFSHFLPRIELLLEKRFLTVPQLPKAAGSRFLGERVKAMRPDVHVFGHTHFGWDATHDGVRFLQAALAYPNERKQRWHTLSIGDFGRMGPLCVWSSDSGFVPKMNCRWSGYYEHHLREPSRVWELADYAARMFQQIDKRAKACVPDFSHEGPGATPPGRAKPLLEDPAAPRMAHASTRK